MGIKGRIFNCKKNSNLNNGLIKRIMSILVVVLMVVTLLPTWTAEAGDSGYTIYFDSSNNPTDNGWSTTASMYVYGFDASGNSGIKAMQKSSRGDNLWEYTFDKKYTSAVFLPQSSWPSNNAGKTQDVSINWNYASPCFKLDGGYVQNVGSKTGVLTDLGSLSQEGKTLKFVNMTGKIENNSIVAIFGIDENFTQSKEVAISENGEFIVPNDENGQPYKYVSFKQDNKKITGTYEVTSNKTDGTAVNVSSGNIVFYYATTEKNDDTKISYWGKVFSQNQTIGEKKIYLDKISFPAENKTYIKIGNGSEVELSVESDDPSTLSYKIPSGLGATQQTIITIRTEDNNKYNFLWSDLGKNVVSISENIATVSDIYSKSYTVYFDATFSKLSYVGDAGDKGIPKANSEIIYYYAWSGSVNTSGTMTKMSTKSNGTNTWSDVYKADLNQQYDNILFYSSSLGATDCTKTVNLTIPKDISSPCFYADSSDDSIYKSTLRSGYWDEIYTVRDPEKEGNINDSSKESEDSVVNLEKKEFTKVQSNKYVSSTFYDFYTDYELNGKDRDSYQSDANITSHRIYQPFRQFDQALSNYYKDKNASNPIYCGNFQNYSGSKFTEIANTLNLYGYGSGDLYNKFFYENNSMWGRNGAEITKNGENATLGLVNSKLGDNSSLLIKTSDGSTAEAPYFNEEFLSGNNSKNSTLGKVYENVEFPFEKKALTSKSDTSSTGTVDYWTFDSKTRSLEMKQAQSTGQYYLENRSGVVKGRTTSGETTNGNFFPFNTTAQSGNAARLNYGFGMKLEFEFRLTSDGTVTTTTGDKVPIEFNFSGDDDVWVFIDGELALDIGGGHGVVSGTLDFKNKKYNISRVKGATSGFEDNKTGTFTMDGDNTSTHTLTMFYMERGLWESNMSISYNFPDENKISVEKQVDTTDVNDLFKDYFYNHKIFTFNIKNRVTHFGSQEFTGESVNPIIFNDTFSSSTIEPSSNNNTFKYVSQNEGKSNVVYWKAKYDDILGSYIKNRLGIIQPATANTLDVSNCNKFLQFSTYFSDNKNLSLDNIYIEVEDSSGNTISGWLSSKKLYGAISLKANQWQKITIDLAKLESEDAYDKFDFKNVKYVKFGFKYEQGIYLDDITFKPEATAEAIVGFQTPQSSIPDYRSATSGNLENAVDALFSIKSLSRASYYKVDLEGDFSLAHGDIATFTNQFRRGSYISLTEDIDSDVFSTKWTLFENGIPVSWYGSGTTVKNPSPTPSLIEQEGIAIDDGRIENVDNNSAQANYSGNKPDSNTIVFRSYKSPDDEVSDINLNALFVNKVRTGSLIIKKDKSDTSPNLNGTYNFTIIFKNIANMSLEDNPIVQTVTLRYGEEYRIEGIPAGTTYYIQETNADDGAKLETIEVDAGNDKNTINYENMSVSGVITADDGENPTIAKYTFKNTTRKKISIELEKKWQDENGVDIPYDDSSLPDSINVQLQRKLQNEPDTAYEAVVINDKEYVEVTSGYEGWKYTFNGLDGYKDTEETQKYVYRIVEVEVSDNGDITIPENNRITLNGENYVIELGEPVSDNSQYIITNKKVAGSITIKKIDENNEALKGAKFKLEKKNSDGQTWAEITTLDMTDLSEGKFENLEMGDYRITEIKAPSGYNILKEPIEVTLPYAYNAGDIVNGDVVDSSGTTMDITFTVTNVKGSILPTMGGNGTLDYIFVGVAIISISFAMYFTYKKRNENLLK